MIKATNKTILNRLKRQISFVDKALTWEVCINSDVNSDVVRLIIDDKLTQALIIMQASKQNKILRYKNIKT